MRQNARSTKTLPAIEPYQKFAFDQFLSYCALGGLIATDDGKLEKIPVYQFCQRVGVDQATTWRWKNSAGFATKVRERRDEIVPLARETMAFNKLFMLGMQTQDKRAAVDALKTYLGHFSELRLPTVRQEIKVQSGLMDVLAAAEQDGILEGEIVEPANLDTATGQEAPGTLPTAP